MIARVGLAVAILVAAGSAHAAKGVDLHQLARTLGAMLGSEKDCSIAFEPDKIEAFIRAKVPPTDIEFMDRMSMVASNTEYGFAKMTAALKAAHCEQMRRLSVEFGLVK